MQLPFTHKSDSATPRRYVFGLEISPGSVKCAIWTLANNKPQVVAVSHSVPWDDKSARDLTEAVDKCLTDATNHLDPSGNTQISEVIFGVPTTWVNEDKIISSKLAFLKEMSTQLELKAVGFVVTPEAIVKLLQQNENVPSTAILIGFWETELEVSLVKVGKIVGTQNVKRSQNVTADVVEGLSRFQGQEVLPSRMLLYDSTIDLEEVKQLLLQYPWATSSKKIPFLHFPKIEVLPGEFSVKAVCLAAGAEVVWDEAHPQIEEVIEEATNDLGSDLGFAVDGEAGKNVNNYQPVEMPAHTEPAPMRKLHLPKFHFHFLPVAIVGGVLGIVLGLAYWFLPKAAIRLSIAPKDFAAEANVVLDTNTLNTSVDQSQQTPTTGSKIVGDKATGSVTISSNLDTAKFIAAGTILNSPSGLKFITLQDVTVASASGAVGDASYVSGKATVDVSASAFGTDSNLSSGTVFRVDSLALTQIAAKNDTAFSGGSSRQVKAVSQDDVTKLETQITSQAKQLAQDKLNAQIDAASAVVPESVVVSIANEVLNPKVGEAGDNLNLQVTAKASALTVNKADLDQAVNDQLMSQLPAGFNIDQSSQSLSVVKTDKNKTTFKIKLTAKLLPQINKNELIKKLVGASSVKATNILSAIPNVTKVDISLVPPLPKWLLFLPHISGNIDLQILAQ